MGAREVTTPAKQAAEILRLKDALQRAEWRIGTLEKELKARERQKPQPRARLKPPAGWKGLLHELDSRNSEMRRLERIRKERETR